MTGVSLALVLVAAFIHASWNLLAKRAGDGGVVFVWLTAMLMAAIYAPIAIGYMIVTRPELDGSNLVFIVGSGLIHLCYFTVLQHGYRVGDLSLVYPLARGTGPMLSTAAAIVFLGERPTPLAIAGAACVCGGVFVLGATGRSDHRTGPAAPAIAFGLITGGLIACYTLWDRNAVAVLATPPLILDVGANLVRGSLLTPVALRRREVITRVWREHRREVIGVAALAPLSYILVLTAFTLSPVSYIAPAREVSILIGTLFGVHLLREGRIGLRLVGAGLIVAGVVALALG